jgi:hypothetical protein
MCKWWRRPFCVLTRTEVHNISTDNLVMGWDVSPNLDVTITDSVRVDSDGTVVVQNII